MSTPATTSQTVGPYFKIGLLHLYQQELAGAETEGERITIQGRVLDGEGNPVPDAILEIWQADAKGNYLLPENGESSVGSGRFIGFGRIPTDATGSFCFSTIRPGSVQAPDGSQQAPHIAVSLFMRGLLRRLVTRIYFSGDSMNDSDFILKRVDKDRRATLLATLVTNQENILEWNVNLQGVNETVFFDF